MLGSGSPVTSPSKAAAGGDDLFSLATAAPAPAPAPAANNPFASSMAAPQAAPVDLFGGSAAGGNAWGTQGQ